MLRQRVRISRSPLHLVGRALMVLLALALVWYGGMTVLLAFKFSPDLVESLSGYRSAYDFLSELEAADITSSTRLVVGLAGAAGFVLFGYLALKELPRPRLARSAVRLSEGERGTVDVAPRAIERVAEVAAYEGLGVTHARGLLADDELTLELGVRGARGVADGLRGAQERAGRALRRHELPVSRVNVTLTRFDKSTKRELA